MEADLVLKATQLLTPQSCSLLQKGCYSGLKSCSTFQRHLAFGLIVFLLGVGGIGFCLYRLAFKTLLDTGS